MYRVTRHPSLRRRVIAVSVGVAGLVLASCSQTSTPGGFGNTPVTPTGPSTAQPGSTIGTGPVRVALILPLSAGNVAGNTARDLKNAAELGLKDFQQGMETVTILVKDDGGSTEGGQAAAQAAIAEGAQVILGPLFGLGVKGAAVPARQAGVPIVSFSSDTSVATRGVYTFGFLPGTDVERIVSFAATQGKKSYAAILPEGAYGTVAEAAFRQAVGANGGRVVAVEKYSSSAQLPQIGANIARIAPQIDAVLVPDVPANASAVARSLRDSGVDLARIRLLGSGQWDDPSGYSAQALATGWFPGPDQAGMQAFRSRYRGVYGSDPSRVSVLGYEAAVLAAGLARSAGANPYREDVLLSRNGFLGTTGIFRFNPDGSSQRGLAVFEMTGGAARVLSPAPRSFAGG
ncbi:MAG: penicillin-binding protein activator [Hyphomicrobiaceae bacterium]|nr:penicillin-binding protein activator [Hyphomicrobiaceae bacterium]